MAGELTLQLLLLRYVVSFAICGMFIELLRGALLLPAPPPTLDGGLGVAGAAAEDEEVADAGLLGTAAVVGVDGSTLVSRDVVGDAGVGGSAVRLAADDGADDFFVVFGFPA